MSQAGWNFLEELCDDDSVRFYSPLYQEVLKYVAAKAIPAPITVPNGIRAAEKHGAAAGLKEVSRRGSDSPNRGDSASDYQHHEPGETWPPAWIGWRE